MTTEEIQKALDDGHVIECSLKGKNDWGKSMINWGDGRSGLDLENYEYRITPS